MGKKRIITDSGHNPDLANKSGAAAGAGKRKMSHGMVHVEATYNNTKITLTDSTGQTVAWSSSGHLGFRGAKKGTPFAASKVVETLLERVRPLGLSEVAVVVKGVGAGRESAIRALSARGLQISSIKDVTPVPFNGPRPPKPRRV
jgi:small subunit ribosomal protein S11